MTFKVKLLFALGTFAIVAIIGIIQYIGRSSDSDPVTTTNTLNSANTSVTNSQIVTPKATNDINAVVDAFVAGASAESTQVTEETVDEASVTGDSQDLQTYSQSYDESEL